MARGEITINEKRCTGCGYCAGFCSRGCITMPRDKFTPLGFLLSEFTNPEKCNACGVCGWMCPECAIEVYKYIEAPLA